MAATNQTMNLSGGRFVAVRWFFGAYGDLVAGGLSLLLLAVLAIGGTLGGWWSAAKAESTKPLRPVILIATATPGAVSVAAVPTLPETVAAFAAPNGAILGTAPAGAAYSVVGRTDSGWLLLRVAGLGGFDGAGSVWVAGAELPAEIAQAAPLLAPTPEAPTPQPARQAPIVSGGSYAPPAQESQVIITGHTESGLTTGQIAPLPDRPFEATDESGRVVFGGRPDHR